MNCQRAEVSRLLICRHRNSGFALVPQIGHNVWLVEGGQIKTFVPSNVIKINKEPHTSRPTVPPACHKLLLCAGRSHCHFNCNSIVFDFMSSEIQSMVSSFGKQSDRSVPFAYRLSEYCPKFIVISYSSCPS